jgi:hypothetical protein
MKLMPSIKFYTILTSLLFIFLNASAQRIIAHYPMNNAASDISPFRNNGNIFGGVTPIPDRFGNPCSALLFDGRSGYIEVPSSSSLESPRNQISFTVWYKLSYTNSNNKWLTVLCKGGGSVEESYNPQYRLQTQQNTTLQINTCSPYTETGSSTISLSTAFTKCDYSFENHLMPSDEWHFYALTYDGNQVKVFMDGELVFFDYYSKSFETNSDPLFIGKDIPGNTEYFNGALDELKIYDFCLSPNAIKGIYNEKGTMVSNKEDFEMEMPQNIVLSTNKNDCFATATFAKPKVTNNINCGQLTLNQIEGLPSGSAFPVGRNRIVFEAKSTSGYTQIATFYIEVKDKISPNIYLQKDTTIQVKKGSGGAIFEYNYPIATDNCTIKDISLKEGKQSGEIFPIGKTKIAYTATDLSGNTASTDFTVTIKEIPELQIQKPDTPVIVIPDTPVIVKQSPPVDTVQVVVEVPEKDSIFIPSSVKYTDTLSTNYKPNNIVFVIDASSSMAESNKMDNLKYALIKLVKILRTIDYITIVTYADTIKLNLSMQKIENKDSIINLINNLKPFGGTEGAAALEYSYSQLKKNYLNNANNEIYVASDMEFDLEKKQQKLIKSSANDMVNPIRLNIMAFAKSSNPIDDLKAISDLGKGAYLPINSEASADFLINQIKIKSIK